MQLSIILPCYNEAENLPLLLEAYRRAWQSLPAELILVNNGSTDNTAQVLTDLLVNSDYPFARVVTMEHNQGYGHGIFTGLQAAQGQFLAWSHADMQCAPADVFRAYYKLIDQPNPRRTLIKGKRASRGLGASIITNGMAVIASTVLGMRLTDINAQPKVFHCDLLNDLANPPPGFQFDLYVLYRAKKTGMSIETLPVEFGVRAHGQSKWAFSYFSRWDTIWATIKYIFRLRMSERQTVNGQRQIANGE